MSGEWSLPEQVSAVTGADSYVPPVRVRGPRKRNSEVTTIRPDPKVWATALRLANDDPARCRVEPDGSVLVRNLP